ncbi:MAG: class I SAM-dependent methyltransferase [Gammaproteobacteria bacterium]|nr:class I SAM-dependent methyltransferase [Gammaproteobacteria bacterium]
MKLEAIEKAYRRYAHLYDVIFGPVLHPGRKIVVESMDCQPGDGVLEVGVGTGLSLPLYPDHVRVTGIDISREMLAKARARITEAGLTHVEQVLEMDAENMQFADDSFDKVVAMYVASVVSDPVRLVDEMRRVCRPSGEIVIVNHFRSRNPVVKTFEGTLAPLSKVLGFHPDLELDDFLEATELEVVKTTRANMFGYWKILTCRNNRRDRAIAA